MATFPVPQQLTFNPPLQGSLAAPQNFNAVPQTFLPPLLSQAPLPAPQIFNLQPAVNPSFASPGVILQASYNILPANFGIPQASPIQQGLASLAPPAPPTTIAPLLRGLFVTIPAEEQGLLPSITREQLDQLTQVTYLGGGLILSQADPEVTLETIGFLRKAPIDTVTTLYRQCADRSDLLWLAAIHPDGHLAVAREVFILQVEESGIKGVIKCNHCGSDNALMTTKQLSSGDEPATIFTRCVDCKETRRS